MTNQPEQSSIPPEATTSKVASPKATHLRRGVVRSDLIAFVILLAFVAVVAAVDRFLNPALEGPGLILIGVVLALAPAALWLFMFYRLDAAEPEPVSDVAKIFVVGLALASAIGIPLTSQLFRIQDWLFRDTPTTVLGAVFIIGGVEAFIVYASVRFFIYDAPEFDERSDGVIYGTAAGIGYATALNLQFILSNQGVALGPGELYVAEVALAHAALGGLLGYFLGKSKMQREPVWWLALGFVLAAVLNGLFYLLRGQLETGDIAIGAAGGAAGGLPSLGGLLISGAMAIVMSALAAFLITRDVRLTLAGRMPLRELDPEAHDRLANRLVLGAFIVTLAIGALTWNSAVNSTIAFDAGGVRGAYPAYFSKSNTEGDLLHVIDQQGSGAEFSISAAPVAQDQTLAEAATLLTVDRAGKYAVYKVLESAETTVNGKQALMQRYTYVESGGLGRTPPQIREGIDYIVFSNGQSIIATLISTPDALRDVTPLFTRFINSLSF